MKKVILSLLLVFGLNTMAQQTIHLRSADRSECLKSDMTSLQASFSFSTIEAENLDTPIGQFSWLSMSNTVIGGNEGDPQIPVVNELIAVPFGAQPRIEITSYSTTDYRLEDLGIQTLIPRQPSLRKDQRPEDVPFVYNTSAYQTRGLRSQPKAVVNVGGTMRGIQLGKMTIEPVSYDPVNNILRVFNDIEVEVHFDGTDAVATEEMLVKTYSPYFDIVYKQLFNGRAIRDVYSQHPDLYTTPVKMLVVTTSTYTNSTAFQNWLTWKKQKGIDVDVQTVAENANADTVKTLIYSRYNVNHPTFLVIVGDETVVTYYQLWDYNSIHGDAATDLEYASVDGDIYHDMFMSRMSVSSITELDNLVNKILTYEKYTMSDPSYLSKVLLIAGADNTWAPRVGRPTINYAANNYFNTSNGFTNVYKYVTNNYSGCYNYLSSGVGFANYTAHGDIQEWYNPKFTNTDVNSLTNNDKYFWAMGNCCLTCNFKNVQNNQTCLGEALIRAANKGAFGYIGSVPETYWYEDYYFGVGATTVINQTPNMSQTQTGAYDSMFDDTGFNTLNAVPFIGNLAVSYAYSGSYSTSGSPCSEEYYWRAYQCFGDGSVMPYHTQPDTNNVSHNTVLPLGASYFTVSAMAGSYVSITVNNEIIGVAQVPESGTVNVPIIEQNTPGNAMIVVTRNQRQPYITTIPMEGGTQYTITLASVMHGAISCDHTTAYNSSLITLTATPELGYNFESWFAFKTGDVNTTVTITDSTFNMPDYDVTVSAIFSLPESGDVIIGGGTTTSSYIPTCAYWNYNLCQQIYKPTEIGCAGTITKVAFKVANSKSTTRTVDIYMSHTNTNAFSDNNSWIAQNTSYRVFSGSVNFSASGWTTITLDTLFQYNGMSNLLLTIDDNTGRCLNYSNDAPVFYTYPTDDNTAIYNYSNTNYNPASMNISGTRLQTNNQVVFTKEVLNTEAYLSLSPTVLNGFEVEVGSASEPQSIAVIGNNLQADLAITAPTGFEVCATNDGTYNSSLTLIPSNSSLLNNVFIRLGNSLEPGDYSGDLTLTSGTTMATVSLSGTVINNTPQYTINATANPSRGGTITFSGDSNLNELVYDFDDGTLQGWTILQGPNGDSPNNWIHCANYTFDDFSSGFGHNFTNGFMLSESYIQNGTPVHPDNYLVSPQIFLGGSINFWASDVDNNYGAEHFAVAVSTSGNTDANDFITLQEWTLSVERRGGTRTIEDNVWYEYTVDLSAYSGLGYVAIHHFDCYDQWMLCVDDITIVEGYTDSISGIFNQGESCTVIAMANEGYNFVNWTEDGEIVSSDTIYSFEVTADRELVANFEVGLDEQTFSLDAGWNWWSTNLDITLDDLKAVLVDALPGTSIQVKGKDNSTNYNPSINRWLGTLTWDVSKMYKIKVTADCEITLQGMPINPASHPFTIVNGANWIGFPLNESMSLTNAFDGFAVNGDKIKSKNGTATYTNGRWQGSTLNTLVPGKGYRYISNTQETRTFTFPISTK